MRDRHLVLVGVYRRPGSQTLTSTFYDELAAGFERLSIYSCPIIVCGDFNTHVDEMRYINPRFTYLLTYLLTLN